jgi:uncharacterized membrane protein YuzA (DUF378 family)
VPYPPPFSPFHFFLNWGLVGHLSELFLRNILRPSDVEDTWSLCRYFLVGFQGKPYSGTLKESMEEEDQETPGGETLLLRWR